MKEINYDTLFDSFNKTIQNFEEKYKTGYSKSQQRSITNPSEIYNNYYDESYEEKQEQARRDRIFEEKMKEIDDKRRYNELVTEAIFPRTPWQRPLLPPEEVKPKPFNKPFIRKPQ